MVSHGWSLVSEARSIDASRCGVGVVRRRKYQEKETTEDSKMLRSREEGVIARWCRHAFHTQHISFHKA